MKPNLAVARVLLDIEAVVFTSEKPIRFKSGILSPVYIDNRKLPYYPKPWGKIIKAFQSLIESHRFQFDVLAGIETAGIPHASVLGYELKKPSVFIRKEVKDHGTKKMIEGGAVKGKRVLLIEDHISTGGSSLHGVRVLKNEGAKVVAVLSISNYGWTEAAKRFAKVRVPLFTLVTFPEILMEAQRRKLVSASRAALITRWSSDPKGWEKKS